jgi:hypothetical protein
MIAHVGTTMPCLPPILLGMVYIYHQAKNGDDWGMVQMALFYPHELHNIITYINGIGFLGIHNH